MHKGIGFVVGMNFFSGFLWKLTNLLVFIFMNYELCITFTPRIRV